MSISVHNRQRAVPFNLPWLRKFAAIAWVNCRDESGDARFALKNLEEVEASVVSDRLIANIHQRFMRVAGPTDVITFDYGEIVMSAERAKENAARYSQSIEAELALYTVHGLLHLNGFEDMTPREASRMRRVQTRVVKLCLAQMIAL